MNGDGKVSRLRWAAVLAGVMWWCGVLGPLEALRATCLPDACAQLLYVPSSGDAAIDGRSETAPVWAFALQGDPARGVFQPKNFRSPFVNGVSESLASTNLITDFDPAQRGGRWLQLGTIITAGVSPDEQLASRLQLASYATLQGDEERLLRVTAIYPGRLDGDQDVDSSDLLALISNWTGDLGSLSDRSPIDYTIDYSRGDWDFDLDVDSADLLSFLGAWTGAEAERAMVPEPSGGSVLWIFIGYYALKRRRGYSTRDRRS